jgi:hypothetical protein
MVEFFDRVAAMTDNPSDTGAAIEAHYQFLVWLLPTVEKFPKSHKFAIGDRIEAISARRVGSADRDAPTPRSGRPAPLPSYAAVHESLCV